MHRLPMELAPTIKILEVDYEGFTLHPVGANGYLVFARNRISGADVAIKFYFGEPGDRRHDEPRLLHQITSDNVLPIIDARNVSDEWAYFVTKRCFDGDLDDAISRGLSAHRAIDFGLGIANGATAIHRAGMIHRDLKCQNIIVDEGRPRIADFGSVRKLADNENDVTASQHSVLYRPPESFETKRYSALGDIYQVGLVVYQLLGGKLSYDPMEYLSTRDRKEYDKINDDFDRSKFVDQAICRRANAGRLIDLATLPPWVSAKSREAIRAMTHPDPSQRLQTMAAVAGSLVSARATLFDWTWDGDEAVLKKPKKVVRVRPVGGGNYECVQSLKGGAFRRTGTANGSFFRLVRAAETG